MGSLMPEVRHVAHFLARLEDLLPGFLCNVFSLLTTHETVFIETLAFFATSCRVTGTEYLPLGNWLTGTD